jgi:acyl-CoA reductase-like NAD-dependent aldehyde dehydrogenase
MLRSNLTSHLKVFPDPSLIPVHHTTRVECSAELFALANDGCCRISLRLVTKADISQRKSTVFTDVSMLNINCIASQKAVKHGMNPGYGTSALSTHQLHAFSTAHREIC